MCRAVTFWTADEQISGLLMHHTRHRWWLDDGPLPFDPDSSERRAADRGGRNQSASARIALLSIVSGNDAGSNNLHCRRRLVFLGAR